MANLPEGSQRGKSLSSLLLLPAIVVLSKVPAVALANPRERIAYI